MKKQKKIKNRSFLLLTLFLFSTSLISLKTLKKVNVPTKGSVAILNANAAKGSSLLGVLVTS